MSSGSAVPVSSSSSPISRMQSDRNSQNINLTQNQLTNSRNLYQNQQYLSISANNNSDLQINNSSNTSNIKTESVVTSASDLNIKNIQYLGTSNLPSSSSSISTSTLPSRQISSASTPSSSTPGILIDISDIISPSKKRIKLDETAISTVDDNSISALKKRILEHKYLQLQSLKEKYV